MAARVMLLLLAVAAFVAIWSGDRRRAGCVRGGASIQGRRNARPQESAKVAKAAAARPVIPASNAVVAQTRNLTPERRRPHAMVAKHERREGALHTSTVAISIADVPLPGGITPGEYRIVRSDGQVQRLRLTAEELRRRGLSPTDPPREFYRLHDGRVRWYYIRVDAAQTGIVRSPAAPSIRSAVTRKPRSAWHVLQAWISGAKPLRASLLRPLQTTWSAGRLAAVRAVVELSRRWRTAVDAAFEQIRQTAVRARRIAAESGATQR